MGTVMLVHIESVVRVEDITHQRGSGGTGSRPLANITNRWSMGEEGGKEGWSGGGC